MNFNPKRNRLTARRCLVVPFAVCSLSPLILMGLPQHARSQETASNASSYQRGAASKEEEKLFDGGSNLSAFVQGNKQKPTWKLASDRSLVAMQSDLRTLKQYAAYQIHLEFKLPTLPDGKARKNARSGILLQGGYEIRICDSFGVAKPGKTDCGAILNRAAPSVNACKKPSSWQSLGIVFHPACYVGTDKKTNAFITVYLNDRLIQDNVEIASVNSSSTDPCSKVPENSNTGPLCLEYKGSPVHFRNITVLELSLPPDEEGAERIADASSSDSTADAGTRAGKPADDATLAESMNAGTTPAPFFVTPESSPVPSDANNRSAVGDLTSDFNTLTPSERVNITQASFDLGGYQLTSDTGQKISVPFANQNPNVMQFASSTDGETYFVNNDSIPTLYMPSSAYITNASVPTARWYPISTTTQITQPVYVRLASSWAEFAGMSWYNGMQVYGGEWSTSPTRGYVVMAGSRIRVGNTIMTTTRDFTVYSNQTPGAATTASVYTHPARNSGASASANAGQSGTQSGGSNSNGSGRSVGGGHPSGSSGSGGGTGAGGSGGGRGFGGNGSGTGAGGNGGGRGFGGSGGGTAPGGNGGGRSPGGNKNGGGTKGGGSKKPGPSRGRKH